VTPEEIEASKVDAASATPPVRNGVDDCDGDTQRRAVRKRGPADRDDQVPILPKVANIDLHIF
jgi:hypothetical protein